MIKRLKRIIIPALLSCLAACSSHKEEPMAAHQLESPNGENIINFKLENSSPRYSVLHGETAIIEPSAMGFVFQDNDSLYGHFEVLTVERSSYDETWEQVWGEKQEIRNNYNQLVVKLQEKTEKQRKLEIQFRAFNDGVAFRYVFPEQ